MNANKAIAVLGALALAAVCLSSGRAADERWKRGDIIRVARRGWPAPGLPARRAAADRYARDRLLLKIRPDAAVFRETGLLAAYGLKVVRRLDQIGVVEASIPAGIAVEEAVAALRRNPDVAYAEPDFKTHLDATPNDEYFSRQYALYNPGSQLNLPGSPTGKARADIHATAAWEETKGTADIVIAVVDTGIDFEHPDLKNKTVSRGRDFVNGDDDATDDNGHGTHVSGLIAADTNNGQGIAGVAWNSRVLPLKAIDKEGSGLYTWLIDAILWAADHGASVINLSVGGDDPADALRDALKYAVAREVVCVASAGNDGVDVDYPAAYDEYVLAVAATDYNDARPDWSSPGAAVDVAAPGVDILSTVPTWYWGPGSLPYGYADGTSAAAPHASGLAALLKGLRPWLTAREIMQVIRYTADDVNAAGHPGKDTFIGYGRINMERALVPYKLEGGAR